MIRIRSVFSSMTISPAVPTADPAAFRLSASMQTPSRSSPLRIIVEEPPGMTALIRFPPCTPPAYFSMISRRGTPVGISYTPGLFTCPLTPTRIGPGCFGTPIFEYASQPIRRINGTFAIVSTLLIVVGHPQTPYCAGNGGLMRGYPLSPSREFISADSSPQIYAPAPRWRYTFVENPESRIFEPTNPLA